MQRKEITWIIILIVLGVVYLKFFSGWGVHKAMLIRVTQRQTRRFRGPTEPVFFILSDKYKLTSVEVIPINGDTFNPHDRPVWHLVTASNSAPLREFRYGQHIRGMQPALTNVEPDPLAPGMPYRLLVSAGPVSGSVDFRTKTPQE